MIVSTWNTEWRRTGSADAEVIRARLAELQPELVCLTETHADFLEGWGGYSICGADVWDGKNQGDRREVLLWSKRPWSDTNVIGSPNLPSGRFVMGKTFTSLGEVSVAGLLIPYHMSNVRHGTRGMAMWELHRQYLEALPSVTAKLGANSIVMGDFNQRIPGSWVPKDLRGMLLSAFDGFEIASTGPLSPMNDNAIDHIVLGKQFEASRVGSLSNKTEAREVSDHFGVWAEIEVASLRT